MTSPFKSLPLETRVQILLDTDSLATRRQLALTCPSMREAVPLATRSYVRSRLSDDLVQDAMAIILLPPDDSTDESQTAIAEHLDRLSSKMLPNPLRGEDDHPEHLEKLEELIDKVERLMEDYVSKATSKYLVHSYLRLPPGSNPAYASGKFDKADCGGSGCKLSDLTESERERLFKAFFRHGFFCQLQPIVPHTSCRSACVPFSRPHNALPGSFRVTHSDTDMMQCVHEYLRSLYGAIAARLAVTDGPPIPRLPNTVHVAQDEDYELGVDEPRGRVFPDHLQFEPELCLESSNTADVSTLLDCMAGSGLDLVTRLLAADRDSAKTFFWHYYDELTVLSPKRGLRFGYLLVQDAFEDGKYSRQGDELAAKLWAEYQERFHYAKGVGILEEAFVRMYRQRAWAFFDSNDRFHRDAYISLCSFDEFEREEVAWQTIYGDANIARLQGRGYQPALHLGVRRSPFRREVKRGAQTYPTLQGMLS